MKKLSNTGAELKKIVAFKKSVYMINVFVYRQNTLIHCVSYLQIGKKNHVVFCKSKQVKAKEIWLK